MSTPSVQPAIKLLSFVVQDLSFKLTEVNSANPESIQDDLNFRLTHHIGLPQDGGNSFIVVFELQVDASKSNAVNLSMKAVAEFETNQPVDEEFGRHPLIQNNGPAIAFPFLRSYVHTVTIHSGTPGIILPAMTFRPPIKKAPDGNTEGPSIVSQPD